MRVGLVGCVKTKAPAARPAQDLYLSPLFVGRRSFVIKTCDQWFILSAKYGVLSPTEVIAPYEQTLAGTARQVKREWTARVLAQLDALDFRYHTCNFEIHAGADYRDFGLVEGLRFRGAEVVLPTAHLGQGEQLAFYGHHNGRDRVPRRAPVASRPTRAVIMSRYGPLRNRLSSVVGSRRLTLTFGDVERIIGQSLPTSARKHRAWWANDSTHSHAAAWLSAGWLVERVDFSSEQVSFAEESR